MAEDALTRLVADANRLPISVLSTDSSSASDAASDVDPASAAVALPRSADRRHKRKLHREAAEPDELKTRVRELLFELSRRVDEALAGTLERSHAWDQIDALRVIDRAVDDEVAELRESARVLEEGDSAERRALGLEAKLTIDAVMGLVSLVEKRLATLIRLRLRTGDDPDQHALLPSGRPFLDLGAALHETARRWT